ncbi:MAG: DUF2029 domain-containing protein [Planctomycetia bacterium]|nr:DUF2029 domain-containing protein [Planctomycetia bacterium]
MQSRELLEKTATTGRGFGRRAIYVVLIAISSAMMLARVARVDSPDPKSSTPFLSANDRSRWATIRALGDEGTYVLDDIIFDEQGRRVRGWHTIDLVRHRGPDGKEHYYSSKPTLLTTLLGGEYWVVKNLTDATLAEQPHYVARLMLVLTNVLPLAAGLWLLARMIDGYGATDWGRVFAVGAACFATFMTTFAVTLNNHTVAAVSLMVGLAVMTPIFGSARATPLQGVPPGQRVPGEWWRFAVAGLSFGFLAANELPAMSLLCLVGAVLLWKAPAKTLVAFLPAVIVIGVAALGTNILAHGDWRTPYAHRSPGDNWYDYPGSYWLPENLRGIDVGESSPWRYAFNCLIGHHGLFSLTPIWVLSAAGCGIWIWRSIRGSRNATEGVPYSASSTVAVITLLTSAIVLGFYLTRPQIDRNYGGGTCCLRWLIWLTPLWLVTLLPAVDWLSRNRWGRALCVALLVVSVFSASYATDNPWSHPWIFDYWTAMGWIDYE